MTFSRSTRKWVRNTVRQLPFARWLKNTLFKPPVARGQAAFHFKDYWKQVDESYGSLTNSFRYYELLIEELRARKEITILPLYGLAEAREPRRRLVGLRHDIDGDPITALRAARLLARYGICGSFYILHTALYYGQYIGDRFVRHPELEDWILSFMVAGCELGLHNDAFGVCNLFGKNGARAVQEELAWLRQCGAVIRGTVGHNSGPAYQAENYEVFRERVHWQRKVTAANKRALPLGALDEKQMGLTYEGTFSCTKSNIDMRQTAVFFSAKENAGVRWASWMKTFLHDNPYRDFTLDCQFWLVGKDEWIVSGRYEDSSIFRCFINLVEVLRIIDGLPPGTKTLFVLHPEYFRA
jgi:hypothetical protein